MKEIKMLIRLYEDRDQVASLVKSSGFSSKIETIVTTIGLLENLKEEQLKKLQNLRKDVQ